MQQDNSSSGRSKTEAEPDAGGGRRSGGSGIRRRPPHRVRQRFGLGQRVACREHIHTQQLLRVQVHLPGGARRRSEGGRGREEDGFREASLVVEDPVLRAAGCAAGSAIHPFWLRRKIVGTASKARTEALRSQASKGRGLPAKALTPHLRVQRRQLVGRKGQLRLGRLAAACGWRLTGGGWEGRWVVGRGGGQLEGARPPGKPPHCPRQAHTHARTRSNTHSHPPTTPLAPACALARARVSRPPRGLSGPPTSPPAWPRALGPGLQTRRRRRRAAMGEAGRAGGLRCLQEGTRRRWQSRPAVCASVLLARQSRATHHAAVRPVSPYAAIPRPVSQGAAHEGWADPINKVIPYTRF
jgi:hypothetical protein